MAVLDVDPVWEGITDIAEVPAAIVDRLEHYFLTYKEMPGVDANVRIPRVYGAEHALRVVDAAMADYEEEFGGDRG